MRVKLTVPIDPELKRRAKAAAALKGLTLSDVVRTALEKFVQQNMPQDSRPLAKTDPS